MTYTAMAYIVMAYMVMVCIVMAYMVMVYIVMATCPYGTFHMDTWIDMCVHMRVGMCTDM